MKAIERLYKYLESNKLKPTVFERQAGISSGYLSKQRSRQADIGESILIRIIENCPEMNLEWLLTGNGSMLREKTSTQQPSPTILYADNPDKEEILSLQRDKIKYLSKENSDLKKENEGLKNALTALSKTGVSYTGSQETQTPINPLK